MRFVLLAVLSLVLAGCAAAPAAPSANHLFRDSLFAPATERIAAADVFAVTDEMRRYLREEIGELLAARGRPLGLYEALYSRKRLKIEYDTAITRNAPQTFEARSGNCLSLAIMTAALAKELGLTVRYQGVHAEELWTRSGGIYFSSRHVNVTLGRRHTDPRSHFEETNLLTIDFQPVGELQKQTAWAIPEATVIAMYMNNRAAEVLAQGKWNDAYWWARAAIEQDPAFMGAVNTLGVIYRRVGHLADAEGVLRHVLAQEPANTHALSNLALVLADVGRVAEADAISRQVQALQPRPPFHFFERGLAAMRRGDFLAARDDFVREVERDPGYHEFRYWLAAAYVALGDYRLASQHLRVAIEKSPGAREHDIYAAKLAHINSR
ncbi:MAG: tetratricopeptide repeat protein [Usitatibacter sp.]